MKIIATLSVCLFVFCTSYGQQAATHKSSGTKVTKPVFMGSIRDTRNKPIKGVKAFVYKQDSTIVASGYTDSTGHFETNSVPAGLYFVKIVYPSTKTTMIYGITMKAASMEINLRSNPPDADTMLAYETLLPKPEVKKSGKSTGSTKK